MTRRWACLLGQPVAHSLSPPLHNAAFVALGIDAHYKARLVAPGELASVVAGLRAPDCLGANVTAPHKRAVMEHLDEVSPEAHALGAVNTIVNRRGTLFGSNTDAAGLARWMRLSSIQTEGRAALVLGAGGAARAAVWALADLGISVVTVLNRTVEHAESLVMDLQPRLTSVDLHWGSLAEAAEQPVRPYGIVVNATSLGHQGSAPAVHPGCYSPDSVAIELAYNPPETLFMVAAQQAGARTENGLGMLLYQAALAFERWTGHAPPVAVYEQAMKQTVAP